MTIKSDKYKPLANHLENLRDDEVTLTFEEIGKIISAKLPKSANSRQFWENSITMPGQRRSHQWQAAGWKVKTVYLIAQRVVFTRAEQKEIKICKALIYQPDSSGLPKEPNIGYMHDWPLETCTT